MTDQAQRVPTGTVTFLFTDIEGSTQLWEQHPAAMRQALVRHDALVEQIVVEHQGQVVRPRGEGDSRFAVFSRATDAIAAAAALQQALHAEPWPTPTPLRVRMALHTGEGDLRDGDYYGSAVNRCARLRAVAHGGQILISTATQELVRDALLTNVTLQDLGAHRLKDLVRPEQVFQLNIQALPTGFPPLKSLDAHPHNLPLQREPLIGRAREVADVVALLTRPEAGLVTLTGPGGIGKTRLSQHVAAELLEEFADGVWFVDLAPITDPALVLSTIAQTLGIKEVAGQAIAATLVSSLRAKHVLLVLDNFEQIVSAAPTLMDLLSASPHLHLLVTSRERLRLYDEYEYPVAPLALPDTQHLPPLEHLSHYAAVALFLQRARVVKPDFGLTHLNAAAVVEICVRLDGLPLAIELAAARIKLFPPQALLARLDNLLKLLTGGARDRSARQQTLRGAIDWSFQLLDAPEQRLFISLGVFTGGCTIEAAAAICMAADDLGLDIVDGLASLTDKSLVHQIERDGEPRFVLLETIRAYAWEQLQVQGAAERLRWAHALYFLDLAEAADPRTNDSRHRISLGALEVEHPNLRAALVWSQEQSDRHMIGLRLAGALGWFWNMHTHFAEAWRWLDGMRRTLSGRTSQPEPAGAKVLLEAGWQALYRNDYAVARDLLDESLVCYRALDDVYGTAYALLGLGRCAFYLGDVATAVRREEESLVLFRRHGSSYGISYALLSLSDIALAQGDAARAVPLITEALAHSQELGEPEFFGWPLLNLGRAAIIAGDLEQATSHLMEAEQIFSVRGNQFALAQVLAEQARVALGYGDHRAATCLYRTALTYVATFDHLNLTAACLVALANLSLVRFGADPEQAARAACMLGAVEAFRERRALQPIPGEPPVDRTLMESAALTQDWVRGRAMSLGQAVAYALEEIPDA